MKQFIDIIKVNKQLVVNEEKVIADNESKFRGQLYKLTRNIIKAKNKIKVVLLAGPSCAGKTTTANLLKDILTAKGKKVITISMDDFFVNRLDTPLLPNGQPDFDGLRAINFVQLKKSFKELFSKGKAWFPRFDFLTGLSIGQSHLLEYDKDTIVIFEGIHVINPELIKHIGTTDVYKVYISTLTGFECDKFSKISISQLRLIRRIIRDTQRRSFSPAKTLSSWKNVCDAEDVYITPYIDSADFKINTTHEYELAVYKEDFFKIVMSDREAVEQLSFLKYFDESTSLNKHKLPNTSLMWEFIDKPE